MIDITSEYARSILRYDRETGMLYWRKRPVEHFQTRRACSIWNARFAGKQAGGIDGRGYQMVRIDYNQYRAHRVIWLIVTGHWPIGEIDHVDCNPLNNRFCNLREASRHENQRNTRKRKSNNSGFKGVSWYRAQKKWRADIRAGGKKIYLGSFDEIDGAISAYTHASKRLHGTFARVS